jgi:hypothetical protein
MIKRQAIPNHRRRKGKKVKSNIDSATHNQTLNQQIHLHDRDHHVLKILTLNVNRLNKFPQQKIPISKLD